MNVLLTLQYLKHDIKAVVWLNEPLGLHADQIVTVGSDVYKIIYNESETFRPTATEILAVNQSLVVAYQTQLDAENRNATLAQLQAQLQDIQQQIQGMTQQ